MLKAYDKAESSEENLHAELLKLRNQILNLEQKTGGSEVRSEVGEKNEYPTIRDYIWPASSSSSTYGPTKSQIKSLSNANALFNEMTVNLKGIKDAIVPLEGKLERIGAPKFKK